MKLNWLYIGIGAVVIYLLWKKFGQKNGQTSNGALTVVNTGTPVYPSPEVVRSDMTQGDIVNELAFASGGKKKCNCSFPNGWKFDTYCDRGTRCSQCCEGVLFQDNKLF